MTKPRAHLHKWNCSSRWVCNFI